MQWTLAYRQIFPRKSECVNIISQSVDRDQPNSQFHGRGIFSVKFCRLPRKYAFVKFFGNPKFFMNIETFSYISDSFQTRPIYCCVQQHSRVVSDLVSDEHSIEPVMTSLMSNPLMGCSPQVKVNAKANSGGSVAEWLVCWTQAQ